MFTRKNGAVPHTIRTAWENALKRAGVDIVTVKELLGYKTISLTMRYSHLSQEHKKKAVEFLNGHKSVARQDKAEAVNY